jgi:zinc/manganese transport system substrate-binding protein
MTILLWQGIRGVVCCALFALLLAEPTAARSLRVMASSTDLIAIAKEIGQDRLEVYTPFRGYEEPELWIAEVFPSWVIKAARADCYIRIGLFADVWADTLITDARNPRIDLGAPGYVDASQGIQVLEVPTGAVDRSLGEIHVQGNPHYLLDPLNAKIVADTIVQALVALAPADAAFFTANANDFKRRLDAAMLRWQEMAMPLRGQKLVTYHKTWSYLLQRFGLEAVGYVEPKPGIEPSPQDIGHLVNTMVREHVRLIIHAPPYHPRLPLAVADQVQRQAGQPVHVLKLPAHVAGIPEAKDYFALFDYLLTTLRQALR